MKKLLFLPLLAATAVWGQNGLTTYSVPGNTGSINGITVDNASNTWIATNNNGVKKFDGTTWTTWNDTNTTVFASNHTYAIGTQGNFVWASIGGHLYGYTGTVWADHISSVDSNLVTAICGNATNTWFATRNGLYHFDGTWSHFTVANSGLASDTINSLAFDPAGNILAGTTRGLSRQNGNGWTNYSMSNVSQLPGNSIGPVYEDATNGLWVCVNGMPGLISGNAFYSIYEMMPTANYYTTNYNPLYSLVRGPHGGVLIAGPGSAAFSLLEVINNRPQFYHYNVRGKYFVYNPADGKTWFSNWSGPAKVFAFDGNGYTTQLGQMSPYNGRLLDVNEVSAAIFDRGLNFMNNNTGVSTYKVPKDGAAITLFSSGLWIAGLDGSGNVHEAAQTYGTYGGAGDDYAPGPLDTISGTTDSATALQYDYIWEIKKTKIQEFQYYFSIGAVQNGTYIPDYDILTWPAHGTGNYSRNLAPFVDVNGNGIYDPLTGGDYPQMKGDEMLYCIYNDNLIPHLQTGAAPMKVEVHATAYAFYCSSVPDSEKVLNYTTYYDFQVYNRSGNPYSNAYLGMFQDVDLGAYDDDYNGCYSRENFSFTYNGRANDGGNPLPTLGTYGAHPPISSLAVLDGPVADLNDGIDNNNDGTIDEAGEKNLMTGFHYFNNDFTTTGFPEASDDYYLYLSGKWKDSTNVTYGGTGYGGVTPTQFMYDGMPYDMSAWTEVTANDWAFDRRALTTCGPFTFNPNQPVHLLYADIFSRDTLLNYGDTAYYDLARNDVRRVRNWNATNSEPTCVQWTVGVDDPAPVVPQFNLYPNPSSSLVTIEYQPKDEHACYELLDLTGRVIQSGALAKPGQTVLSIEDLSSGIYLVRIIDGSAIAAKKLIRQ